MCKREQNRWWNWVLSVWYINSRHLIKIFAVGCVLNWSAFVSSCFFYFIFFSPYRKEQWPVIMLIKYPIYQSILDDEQLPFRDVIRLFSSHFPSFRIFMQVVSIRQMIFIPTTKAVTVSDFQPKFSDNFSTFNCWLR